VVNYVSGGRRQSAILDQDTRSARFVPAAASTAFRPLARRAFFAVISLGPLLLLLAALGLAVVSKAGKVLLPVFVVSQIAAAVATAFLSVSFASSLLLAIVALTACYLALEMLISGHGSRRWLIVASGIAGVVYGVAAGMLAGGPGALPILDFLKCLLLFVVLQGPFYVAGLAISSYAAAFTSKRSFRLALSSVLLAGGITFLVRLLVAS
jgi:hypothetical protein